MWFSLKNISGCPKPLIELFCIDSVAFSRPCCHGCIIYWFYRWLCIRVCCTVFLQKMFLLQESIKTFWRHWGNWIEYGAFSHSVYHKLWEKKKCYDGLDSVWSGDKCVSFRGRRIKGERAAARWMVGNRRDRSVFDRWWDEIEMNSGIVGEKNSHARRRRTTQSGFVISHLLYQF